MTSERSPIDNPQVTAFDECYASLIQSAAMLFSSARASVAASDWRYHREKRRRVDRGKKGSSTRENIKSNMRDFAASAGKNGGNSGNWQ